MCRKEGFKKIPTTFAAVIAKEMDVTFLLHLFDELQKSDIISSSQYLTGFDDENSAASGFLVFRLNYNKLPFGM